MADIRNSIQLQDRMTPVLRSIVKSMESTLKVMQRLDKQSNKGVQSRAFMKATTDIEKANAALQRMQNQLIKVDNHSRLAGSSLSRMANTTNNINSGMSRLSGKGFNLVNLSAAFYLLQNIKNLVSGLMKTSDEAMSIKARIGLFNESEYSKEQLFDQMYQVALKTRTGLEETGNLATRIMISGAMKGEDSTLGAIKVTEIINKAAIAGGGEAGEIKRSLLQLSQALASGMLQGDELRAMREQTPFLSRMIAEGLAKVDPEKFAGVSIGQLKELGRQGELTSEKILKGMFLMEEEIEAKFKQMPRTFGQAMTSLGSIWMKFLDKLRDADGPLASINDAMWKLVDFLSSADGEKFLSGLATGVNTVVSGILWGIDIISSGLVMLQNNGELLKAILTSIALTAAVGASAFVAAFLAKHAVVILVLAALTALFYLLYKGGGTVGKVVGKIVTWLFLLRNRVVDLAIYIATAVTWATQRLRHAFFTVLDWLWDRFVAFGTSIGTWIGMVVGAFYEGITGIATKWENLILGALSGLELLAKGTDAIFGTSTAAKVQEWKLSVHEKFQGIYDTFDPRDIPALDPDFWANAPWSDPTNNGEVQSWDEIKAGFDNNWINSVSDEDAYAIGDKIAKALDGSIGNLTEDIKNTYTDILNNFDPEGIEYTGGNIDKVGEVGKINSDVDISDEDIKILKDIAAKEFLVKLYAIAPQVNANFGDVRETADVNEIMGVLETMIEEAYATSLVTE